MINQSKYYPLAKRHVQRVLLVIAAVLLAVGNLLVVIQPSGENFGILMSALPGWGFFVGKIGTKNMSRYVLATLLLSAANITILLLILAFNRR